METIDDDLEPAVPTPVTIRPRMKNKRKPAAASESGEARREGESKRIQAVDNEVSITDVDVDPAVYVVSAITYSVGCC